MKEIYLAGGCFWGLQEYLHRLKGVINTEVGYANGKSQSTSYEELKHSAHAEVVRVKYDSSIIALAEILERFYQAIDPFSLNRQGNDVGEQYRSGIFYTDESDAKLARNFLKLKQDAAKERIMIELAALKNYVRAEEYHQDYLLKNPQGYCHIDPNLALAPLHKSYEKMPNLDKILSPLEFNVTQKSHTEAPFSSQLNGCFKKGIYVDITSKEPLFSSRDKFDSGCGWPSFSKPILSQALTYLQDNSHQMQRVEVKSKDSNSHLGHVFTDGPKELGGLRYCINGASLIFIPLEKMAELGYGDYLIYVE